MMYKGLGQNNTQLVRPTQMMYKGLGQKQYAISAARTNDV